ncbi:MAG: pyruvate, phosphate dikinase, partial [Gammaproteobacteria bacterium]|nr:pyruvate, phosphate dikinase [Gammaproteobacteria bacterium]
MLIGGKAASLITLMQHGATVPPAFVLTTEAYRRWAAGEDRNLLADLIAGGIEELESRTRRTLGRPADGLIVSVRSGAPVSMPGMMDTVLN